MRPPDSVPGGHAAQVDADAAPTSSERVPDAQSVHVAVPLASAKDPALHGVHTPLVALDHEPGAQGAHAPTAPTGAHHPAAHDTHAAVPSLYVPAVQLSSQEAAPVNDLVPRPQAAQEAWLALGAVPAGQGKQALTDEHPTLSPNVPGGQGRQEPRPGGANVPRGHE